LNNDNNNVKTITMKHISKKEFDRFFTIMKNNPGNTVLENHELYKKELALEANNLMPKELIGNKIKKKDNWSGVYYDIYGSK
jgi:hypothetical protein